MSSTLVTTEAGSAAAGAEGVSEGATGDPRQGQADPVPLTENPLPESLQYVTVYTTTTRAASPAPSRSPSPRTSAAPSPSRPEPSTSLNPEPAD